MRRYLSFLGMLLTVLRLSAGVIERTFYFSKNDIMFNKEQGYDVIEIRDAILRGEIGEPCYPVNHYRIALPPGAEIEKIEIAEIEKTDIPGEYELYPKQPPIPLIKNYSDPEFVPLKPEILEKETPYPSEIVQNIRTGTKGGFQIGAFYICPIRYIPAKGKLELVEYIKLRIYYKEGEALGFHERIIKNMAKVVKCMVVNPEDVEAYKELLKSAPRKTSKILPPGDYEYVIISREDWKSAWEPLIRWKHKKGVPAKFYSIEDILTSYSGDNNQEKVKKFIADAYNTWGTLWFLLGADIDIIKHAPCYGKVGSIIDNNPKLSDFCGRGV